MKGLSEIVYVQFLAQIKKKNCAKQKNITQL